MTPSTTRYEPGEVVLVRFPFTDYASGKKRPAIIVSPAGFADAYGDVVILALTSKEQPHRQMALSQWREAGLPRRTWVKPLVGTIAGTLVDRRMGSIQPADYAIVKAALGMLVAPVFHPVAS
jgi:mRNA interferase MazF